jgi:hypothetical protein
VYEYAGVSLRTQDRQVLCPLWAICGHSPCIGLCSLYPRTRTRMAPGSAAHIVHLSEPLTLLDLIWERFR